MTALWVAHRFPWLPVPCSPHAGPAPSWTGRRLGIFGGHLDHSNEMQTHHPQDCHSIDGCEVGIRTYTAVRPYPGFNQEL